MKINCGVLQLTSKWFNGLSVATKKSLLLFFGLAMGSICFLLVARAFTAKVHRAITPDSITISKDTYMKTPKQTTTTTTNELMPIGKFKGEIDGEFKAFYLAMDNDGKLFVNDSIDYSRNAYVKTSKWCEITREELEEYDKQLHFIPSKPNGIRH